MSDEEFEFFTKEIVAVPLGIKIAQARTDEIIANLMNESLEESLDNLDCGDDYWYPGFLSPAGERPFDSVQKIFSNRRFIKVYEELKQLSKDEQFVYLKNAFDKNLQQYQALMAPYEYPDKLLPDEVSELSRITEGEGMPQSLGGARHAVQAIALLSGALGHSKMWPDLRKAFKNPTMGVESTILDKYDYDSYIHRQIRLSPIMPLGIQAQSIWLLSQHSDGNSSEHGFNRDNIKNYISDEMIYETDIPNYRGRVSMYDRAHRTLNAPLDMQYGSHHFTFLVAEEGILTQIIDDYIGKEE